MSFLSQPGHRPGPNVFLTGLMAGVLTLVLGVLQGCGGGRSGGSTVPPTWLTGVWTGAETTTGTTGRMLILPSGRMMAMDGPTQAHLTGTLGLSGSTLSGSGTGFALEAGTHGAVTFSGSASPSPAAMDLVVSGSAGEAHFNLTPDPDANVAVTLAQLAGSYSSAVTANSTGNALTAAITVTGATGTIAVTPEGGGTTQTLPLTQVAPRLNAFTLDMSATTQGSAATGLAYFHPAQGGTPASVVVMASSADAVYQAIFTLNPSETSSPLSAYAGIWSGSTSEGAATTAVLLPSGAFLAIDDTINVLTGNLALDGSVVDGTALTGTARAFAWTEDGGLATTLATLSGIYASPDLKLTASAGAGTSQSATLSPAASANVDTTLATLVGTYTSAPADNHSNALLTLTIQDDGTYSVTANPDSGVDASGGTLSQVEANRNAFNVTVSDPQKSGLSYYLPGPEGSPDRLVLVLSSADTLFAGTFKRQ